jgi:4-hydroxy-2-oxoheptanedioate aldolase
LLIQQTAIGRAIEAICDSFTAEIMTNSGWHSICSDAQHGLIGYETAVHMLQVISTTPVSPIIRVA